MVTADGDCTGNGNICNSIIIHNYFCMLSDIDECAAMPGPCQHICSNAIPSYYCSCYEGYRLINGHNCSGKYQDTVCVQACRSLNSFLHP